MTTVRPESDQLAEMIDRLEPDLAELFRALIVALAAWPGAESGLLAELRRRHQSDSVEEVTAWLRSL